MKKLFTLVLVLTLILSPMTLNAYAASDSHEVYVTYTPGSVAVDTINFSVEWGSMEFTYEAEVGGTWNPTTHRYDNASPASWHCEDSENAITITNHSSKPLNVTFAYSVSPDYESVIGTFDKTSSTIESAVGKPANEAPSVTAYLNLSGDIDIDNLSEDSLNYVEDAGKHLVGNVLVTINS